MLTSHPLFSVLIMLVNQYISLSHKPCESFVFILFFFFFYLMLSEFHKGLVRRPPDFFDSFRVGFFSPTSAQVVDFNCRDL